MCGCVALMSCGRGFGEARQIRRSADRVGHDRNDDVERRLRRFECRDGGFFRAELALELDDCALEGSWKLAMRGLEAADQIGGGGCFAQKPLVARLLSLRSDSTPVLEYVVGNDKRVVRPVQGLARAGNLGS